MHNSVVKTDDVIGKNVQNHEEKDLGKIEELMLDKVSGKVDYVILSFGGFLGMGDKLFAMPWSIFSYDKNKECFVIPVDKERLKNSPGFEKEDWPDMSQNTWRQKIDQYYSDIKRSF